MDTEALKQIINPLKTSIDDLGSQLRSHQLQMAGEVATIRSDVSHVKGTLGEIRLEVKEVRDDHAECIARANWPLVERHMRVEDDTKSFKLSQPPSKKSDPEIAFTVPKTAARWIPYLIISALLGAALVGALLLGRDNGTQDAVKYFTTMPAYPRGAAVSSTPVHEPGKDTSEE